MMAGRRWAPECGCAVPRARAARGLECPDSHCTWRGSRISAPSQQRQSWLHSHRQFNTHPRHRCCHGRLLAATSRPTW